MILGERVSFRDGERGLKEEIVGIRRFWVRKTEPWAATRRDSKREVRRFRNYTISNALAQVGDVRSYLVNAEMSRCHACAKLSCDIWVLGVGCMVYGIITLAVR